VIAKGAVDVYIPVEVKCKMSQIELTRLLFDYRDNLLEINGNGNIATPRILDHEKKGKKHSAANLIFCENYWRLTQIEFPKIKLENVLKKLSESRVIEKEIIYEDAHKADGAKNKYSMALKMGGW
jgi:hypothetical protein